LHRIRKAVLSIYIPDGRPPGSWTALQRPETVEEQTCDTQNTNRTVKDEPDPSAQTENLVNTQDLMTQEEIVEVPTATPQSTKVGSFSPNVASLKLEEPLTFPVPQSGLDNVAFDADTKVIPEISYVGEVMEAPVVHVQATSGDEDFDFEGARMFSNLFASPAEEAGPECEGPQEAAKASDHAELEVGR
jgi:hypothetical protein